MPKTPTLGRIHVVDPSPLNWLFVLFNTMEEFIRANHQGLITPSLSTGAQWVDANTLQVNLRKGVLFHNREPFTANIVKKNFEEMERWIAPHPPGTWLNLPKGTELIIIDDYTVQYRFTKPDGLALAKSRAFHQGNRLFWERLGFGYAKLGSGEGHW